MLRLVRRRGLRVAGAALLAVIVPVRGLALEIPWFTIDGGGGTSAGGGLALRGTIAQPDAGALTAGSLTLRGGFWASAGGTATAVEGGATALLPSVARLGPSAPNPFRDRSSLRFDLPREGHARIRVYDVTGRVVRTLVDRRLEAGRHEAIWDGRDAQGSRVASGVYLVRMQADHFGATRKIIRLD